MQTFKGRVRPTQSIGTRCNKSETRTHLLLHMCMWIFSFIIFMYLLLILRFSTFSSILDLRHLSSFLLKKPKKNFITALQTHIHTCMYIHPLYSLCLVWGCGTTCSEWNSHYSCEGRRTLHLNFCFQVFNLRNIFINKSFKSRTESESYCIFWVFRLEMDK